MQLNRPIEETVLFIDFFRAMENDDPSILSLDDDTFYDLVDFFYASIGTKKDFQNEQLMSIMSQIIVLRGCLTMIAIKEDNDDIWKIIESYGIKKSINREKIIEEIAQEIKKLDTKYKILDSQIVKAPGKKEKQTAFDVLAKLSLGLEFSLDFSKLTLAEYIGFSKALKDKADAIKSITNKNKKWQPQDN